MINKLQDTLLAVLVEVAYLYPLYYLIDLALKTPLSVIASLWLLVVAAVGTTLHNYFILTRKWPNWAVWLWQLLAYLVMGDVLTKFTLGQNLWAMTGLNRLAGGNLLLFYLWIAIRTGWISRKSLDFSKAVSRFDRNLIIMFGVLLLVYAVNLPVPNITGSLLLGFMGNLFMLSITRPGHEKTRPWVEMAFFSLILLPVLAIAYLLKAYLGGFANHLFIAAQPAGNFLLKVFVTILTFLLGNSHMIPQDAVGSNSNSTGKADPSLNISTAASTPLFIKVLIYLSMAMLFIALVLVLVYLFRMIWLKLRRTHTPGSYDLPPIQLCSLFRNLWQKLLLLMSLILPVQYGVTDAYKQLLKWADWKSFPKEAWETPYEYCDRLSKQFPEFDRYFRAVTECYVSHLYGNEPVGPEEIGKLKRIIKKLYLNLRTR